MTKGWSSLFSAPYTISGEKTCLWHIHGMLNVDTTIENNIRASYITSWNKIVQKH